MSGHYRPAAFWLQTHVLQVSFIVSGEKYKQNCVYKAGPGLFIYLFVHTWTICHLYKFYSVQKNTRALHAVRVSKLKQIEKDRSDPTSFSWSS